MRESRGKVSTALKLKYSMGGAAEGSTMYAFNGFNFVIYTIIFGMPGTLVGLAVFLSIILDGVSDPLIGYLSDRWKSRWGRRHPFIYLASLPMAICVFCIYSPPDALLVSSDEVWSLFGYDASPVQWALALWLFVFASLLKLFHTCYHLPHLALGSELTDDTVKQDSEQIGVLAIEYIITLIDKKNVELESKLIPTALIIRDSVMKI